MSVVQAEKDHPIAGTPPEPGDSAEIPTVIIQPTRGWAALHLNRSAGELRFIAGWRPPSSRFTIRSPLRALRAIGPALVILALLIGAADPCRALQQPPQWSAPQMVPGYDLDTPPPYLVADQNETVHAFNQQRIGNDMGIIYSQWTLGEGWTEPVDLLLPPQAGIARIRGALLDENGMLHVAFYSGNEQQGASMYYSSAWVGDAEDAQAWLPPAEVGRNAGPLSFADLAGDGQGNLFIVYSGDRDGLGLYAVHSEDGGKTWSDPTMVYLTYDPQLWVAYIRTHVDEQSRLHAVWTVVNEGGCCESVIYARLEPDHSTWSEPVYLAEYPAEKHCVQQPNAAPAIIAHQGELFATYIDRNQGGGAFTHSVRRSSDGGLHWTAPVQPFPDYVGTSGRTVFAVDSEQLLHMFFCHRTSLGSTTIQGLWHTSWQGDHWAALDAVLSGPLTRDPPFDPNSPEVAIVQGNTLLATWWTDPGLGYHGVQYAYATLDTPELPAIEWPTPAPTPSPGPWPSPSPQTQGQATMGSAGASVDQAVPEAELALPASGSASSPFGPVLVGFAAAALLVAAVVLVQSIRRSGEP